MGRLVTLHERFAGCLNRIRAKSFKGGSDELNNLEFFARSVKGLQEVSIGHALISDALYFGLENTVQQYLYQLERAKLHHLKNTK